LLLKQGGQEIYVGPLGHHSSNLISYFEVGREYISNENIFMLQIHYLVNEHTFVLKGIQGISKIKDGYNPATWMLEVTTSSKEVELGIDFAEVYKKSELYRYFHLYEG
jgi:hypothetical protein